MKLTFKNILTEIDYEKFYPQPLTYFQDIPVKLENEKGSMRVGFDKASMWQNVMNGAYGCIPFTSAKDKDELDVFIGDNADSDKVYIVVQNKVGTNQFDELKCLLGFADKAQAREFYFNQYDNAEEIYDKIIEMDMNDFKKYLVKNIKNSN